LTDFAAVNSVTGAISITSTNLAGNYTIKIVGIVQDNQYVE
jgi:hypothetical protein